LFGDGAGALFWPAGDGVNDSSLEHTAPIDAVMLIEVLVFDRDSGVAQGRADLLELYRADTRALRITLLDQCAITIDEAYRSGANVELAGIRQRRQSIAGSQRRQRGLCGADQQAPRDALLRLDFDFGLAVCFDDPPLGRGPGSGVVAKVVQPLAQLVEFELAHELLRG